MPNLLDLIKNDAGVQELLTNAGSMAKGAMRGVTTDLVGGPVDLSNLVLGLMSGKGFEGLVKEPVGGSKSIRKAAGQPTEDTAMEAVGNLLTAVLPNPGAAGHALPALIGAIMPGGKATLNMSHGSRAGQLRRALEKSPLLDSISVGIADNNIRPFEVGADSVAMLLNPASHLFDPATNRLNQLFNRDMYASRARDRATLAVNRRYPYDYRAMEGQNPGQLYSVHPDRLDTGQDYGNMAGYGQELALAASPSFRSFREFERSNKGAGALTVGAEYSMDTERLIKDVLIAANGPDYNYGHAPTDLAGLVTVANTSNSSNLRKLATKALADIQRVPSNYAELKMGGRLEVSPDTVTAFVLNPFISGHQSEKVREAIAKAGYDIPTGTAAELVPKEFTNRYEDLARLMTEDVSKARKEDRLLSSGQRAIDDYLKDTPFAPYNSTEVQAELSDYLYGVEPLAGINRAIFSSRQFESDVASFLNAAKLDALK